MSVIDKIFYGTFELKDLNDELKYTILKKSLRFSKWTH